MAAGIDPETVAENWRYVRARLRLAKYLGAIVLAALICLPAYALGYFDGVTWGRANPAPANQTKESDHESN